MIKLPAGYEKMDAASREQALLIAITEELNRLSSRVDGLHTSMISLDETRKFNIEAFKGIAEAIKTLGDGLEEVKAKKVVPVAPIRTKSFIQKILGK